MNGLVREGVAGDLLMVAISSIAVGSVVLAGVWLAGGVLLRRRPAARHLMLNAALLVYLLGPLWILAARVLPDGARQVMQPAVRALAFLDAAEVPLPAPARGAVVAATGDTNAGGVSRGLAARWLLGIWALGSALLLGRVGFGWARVRRMRLAGTPPAAELDAWAQATLTRAFPGRSLPPVRISAEAGSPLVVGTFRPVILLPPAALELDRAQLAQVLVHEMGHVLRGDLRVGLLHRIVAALHWPNPLVHLCRRALERAQEESCDDLVLAATRPSDYARTLLAVAAGDRPALGAGALGMAVGPAELERRIRRVLDSATPERSGRSPAKATRVLPARLASLLTLAATALGGASVVAAASALPGVARPTPAEASSPTIASGNADALPAGPHPYPLPQTGEGEQGAVRPGRAADPTLRRRAAGPVVAGSPTMASARATPVVAEAGEDPEARALFREAGPSVDGAFVMIDVGSGAVRTINPGLAAAAFTPVSTYKVPIAIAALETGVLPDERTIAKWDGRQREIAAWNQDLDLHGAMKSSSNWYFEQVHDRVGEGRMRAWVDKLQFGTSAESVERPTWIDGGRVITPLQQAGFFARFAAGKLPVSPRTQEILRRILVIEERAGVTLRAKTGTAALGGGGTLGWLAGTVEHPGGGRFSFATFFRGSQADTSGITGRRHAITRRLLARWGALPAEMAP